MQGKEVYRSLKKYGNKTIVCGAFIDKNGYTSYGGRDKNNTIINPSIQNPDVYLMNGNLVLIPHEVFEEIDYIDSYYQHGLGDWDYGLRAQKRNLKVVLSDKYVGITDRHDTDINPFWDIKNSILKRIKFLHSPKYSIHQTFYFNKKHYGIVYAYKKYFITFLYTLLPKLLRR